MQLEHETHHIPKNSLNANIIIIFKFKNHKITNDPYEITSCDLHIAQ